MIIMMMIKQNEAKPRLINGPRLIGTYYFSDTLYIYRIVCALVEICLKGLNVVEGRNGSFCLPGNLIKYP